MMVLTFLRVILVEKILNSWEWRLWWKTSKSRQRSYT